VLLSAFATLEKVLRQQRISGQLRLRWLSLRLVWEIGLPLTLLIGARLLLHALGAQSWTEGLLLFPDFGMWLWVFSLLILLTATARLVLLLRVLCRKHDNNVMRPTTPTEAGTRPKQRFETKRLTDLST
jgi:hypothetical protein